MPDELTPAQQAALHLRKSAEHLEGLAEHNETSPDGKVFTPLAQALRKQSAAMRALADKHDPAAKEQ